MKNVSRRKFIALNAVAFAGLPFVTWSKPWYEMPHKETEELRAAFRNPKGTAKPFVRWWWNGGRIVKEEIARELDQLREMGIGGVEINTIAFPPTADPMHYKKVNWLSDEWVELLHYTLEQAKERDIICDVIVGSGWPFGDENLPKEEQTQMMALGTRNLTGPMRYEVKQIALEKEVDPPVTSSNPDKFRELSFLRLSKATLDTFEPGIDLNHLIGKETLVIDIPEGDHVLYYLVKLTGFENVIHGAPGARGPVLNHYNKEAVRKYLYRMTDAIRKKIDPPGQHIRSFFVDSLELEGANWCDDMAEQFRKRRGYELDPYLPFILFKIISHAFLLEEEYGVKLSPHAQEIINNVRYDFETTRMELFGERFYQTYQQWCRDNGVSSRIQAYGMEFNPVEGAMVSDFPECESWIKPDVGQVFQDHEYMEGRSPRPVNKLTTSGARLAGKTIISCEEATNTRMVFNTALALVKAAGDQSTLTGVTHSIYHGFSYSPPDAPFPGWVRYGTFINERNILWPYFKLLFHYKARLSALLQQAEMYADIAVMHPFTDTLKGFGADWYPRPQKSRPSYAHNIWEAIHQNGNGCDCITEKILREATFSDGKMVFGNRRYGVLILIETESFSPLGIMALEKFLKVGGKVICLGKWPSKAAGLVNYEENTRKINDGVQKLIRVYPQTFVRVQAPSKDEKIIEWYSALQKRYQITPYVVIDNPNPFVSQLHYRTRELDIFFFSNYSLNDPHTFRATFQIEGKTPWLWNPETGECTIYPHQDGRTVLSIALEPAESKLIVFEKNHQGEMYQPPVLSERKLISIEGPWDVVLKHLDGSERKIVMETLVDFKENNALLSFGGTVRYETSVTVPDIAGIDYIRLGKVFGVTKLSVNGQEAGTRWYGHHVYPVKSLIREGRNTISIELTTTMGNYMKSLKENPTAQQWSGRRPLVSQGVLGPVVMG